MNWRVFEDDEHTINFIHSEDTFKGSVIDDEQHESLLQDSTSEEKPEHSNTMPNTMPKNIVRLEKLFDLQEKFRTPTNTKAQHYSMKLSISVLNKTQRISILERTIHLLR